MAADDLASRDWAGVALRCFRFQGSMRGSQTDDGDVMLGKGCCAHQLRQATPNCSKLSLRSREQSYGEPPLSPMGKGLRMCCG